MLRRVLAAVFIAMMLTVVVMDSRLPVEVKTTNEAAGQTRPDVRMDRDGVANVTKTPFTPIANFVILHRDVPAADVVHTRPSVVPTAAHTPIIKQQHVFRI
jgi:hypothetical protein